MKPANLVPPVAARIPHPTRLHNTELPDDYFWLREKSSPAVLDYLHAENAYTTAAMAGTGPLQQQLYDEILSHIQEDDVSVPYRDGAFQYLTRTARGSQYARYCRYPVGSPEHEATFLDINQLAVGHAFFATGGLAISPSGNLLAYTTDTTGFRQYTLHLRDLTTGVEQFDLAHRVGSLVWAADSTSLFFTTEDEQTKRHDRCFHLVLGSVPVEVFHEPDERFNLGLGRTRDRRFLLLESASHTTSETHFLDAATPTASFHLIAPRVDDEESSVDHRDGYFYLRTNWQAEQFRLVRTPVTETGREHWHEVLPENPDAPLEDFDLFQHFLVCSYRERGLPVLRVHPLTPDGLPQSPADIRFPDPAYEAHADVNRDFQATTFRYSYQSLVRPGSIFLYDIATAASTLLKEQPVPGGFHANNYESARLWFPATDGTQVPISLVYRKDKFKPSQKEGAPGLASETWDAEAIQASTSPLYLYGYGSYGYALPLGFSPSRLGLLDRGIVVAYAHIRGGGELGDPWHDAGKMMLKRNTFTDFLDATRFLTASGYGDPTRVAIEGGSAGGLLMGAVVNFAIEQGQPDLFKVVLSHVPFVDVMNTMLDASLPLTVAEYEEWGNPNEPEAFATMLSYSPYDNLRHGPYPSMLVKTSLNDSQVMYWEPAKYVARLRTLKDNNPPNDTPLLLHTNMDAGHGGASGRYDYLKEVAFDYAFLLRELGLA